MSVQLERPSELRRNELVSPVRHAWLPSLAGLTVLVLFILGLFYQTFWSIVEKWATAETYTHGFFILPISGWLIWRRRKLLVEIAPQTDVWVVPVMAGLVAVWVAGEFTTSEIIKQYAVVAMLVASVWLVAGRRFVWASAFPLCYLFLAVPVGYFLVPPLMQFTADCAIGLVRLSGIPVYREGLTFTLPTGRWSVLEACSGLRYLIASFTLGCLYAYLTYRSWWRRALFIAASIVVPIIANGLRAYFIVMLGHLSSMRLATGVDHIIYGWLFFGLVMLVLFWVGSFWRQGGEDSSGRAGRVRHRISSSGRSRTDRSAVVRMVLLIGLVGGLLTAGPFYSAYVKAKQAGVTGAELTLPTAIPGWRIAEQRFVQWAPHYVHVTESRNQSYVSPDGPVGVYVGLYRNQQEGAELIAWENGIVVNQAETHGKWYAVNEWERPIRLPDGHVLSVPVTRITDGDRYLDVWHWYWVAGRFTATQIGAKALTLKARLMARSDAASVIAIYAPVTESETEPQRKVLAFIRQALPPIGRNLAAAGG